MSSQMHWLWLICAVKVTTLVLCVVSLFSLMDFFSSPSLSLVWCVFRKSKKLILILLFLGCKVSLKDSISLRLISKLRYPGP